MRKLSILFCLVLFVATVPFAYGQGTPTVPSAQSNDHATQVAIQESIERQRQQVEELRKYMDFLFWGATIALAVILVIALLSGLYAFTQYQQGDRALKETLSRLGEGEKSFSTNLKEARDHVDNLKKDLSDEHKRLLTDLPKKLEQIRLDFETHLTDKEFQESSIFSFYWSLNEKQHAQILRDEQMLPTLFFFLGASKALASALRHFGIYYAGKVYIGGEYLDCDDFDKALFYLEHAAEMNTANTEALDDLGMILMSLERGSPRYKECVQRSIKILSSLPREAATQRTTNNLAWALIGQETPEYEKAIELLEDKDVLTLPFQKGKAALPEYVHVTRACVYSIAKRLQDAWESFGKATENELPGVIRIIFEEAKSGRDLGALFDDATFGPQLKAKLKTFKVPPNSAVGNVEFRNRVYRRPNKPSSSSAISGATTQVISPPPDPAPPSASVEPSRSRDQ